MFVDVFASVALAYGLLGAVYLLRLTWYSIMARFNWPIALLCVWVFWPVVLWSEVGHAVKERARRRAYRVPSKEYLGAVARLTVERRRRDYAKWSD